MTEPRSSAALPAWGFVVSLCIFRAVLASAILWWLKRHERGPMQALWARLTCGQALGAVAAPTLVKPR